MNFSDALIHLRNGECIKRSNWSDDEYIYLEKGVVYLLYPCLKEYKPTQSDILANNWFSIGAQDYILPDS